MTMQNVTQLLAAIEDGDRRAAEELLPLVYDELRRLAKQKLAREAPGQTLQPTALVHEVYLRLVGNDGERGRVSAPSDSAAHSPGFQNRGYFFAAAAEAMRRILVDHARRKQAIKHGGARRQQDVDLDLLPLPEPREDILALDDALDRLAAVDPRKAELVKLRYFVGMTMEEAAQTLGVSLSSAEKYWTYAKAWLYRAMRDQEDRTEGA